MPCFDYEEVTCVRCKKKFADGYSFVKGEVVCDECKEIFDYCSVCGKPLTDSMVEDVDWFCIRNGSESFPICKKCR